MRRSRRNGQMRRTCSLRSRSTSAHQDLRLVRLASARNSPCGPSTWLEPQNWMPGRPERRRFVADAVARQHRQAVGDGVAAVAEDPGIALAILLGLLVVRIPADRGGIQQQLRAGQRHQARAFGIPLVPAHHHAEAADRGVDRLEADVARGEVELLVEARIVRDVHLAVLAGGRAVGFEHHRGVVVQAGRRASRTAS